MELSQLAELFKILGGILALLNFLGVVFLFLANRAAFNKIMTNDLDHLSKTLVEVKDEQVCIKNKVIDLSADVSYIKGYSDAIFNKKTPRRRTAKKPVSRRVSKKKSK